MNNIPPPSKEIISNIMESAIESVRTDLRRMIELDWRATMRLGDPYEAIKRVAEARQEMLHEIFLTCSEEELKAKIQEGADLVQSEINSKNN